MLLKERLKLSDKQERAFLDSAGKDVKEMSLIQLQLLADNNEGQLADEAVDEIHDRAIALLQENQDNEYKTYMETESKSADKELKDRISRGDNKAFVELMTARGSLPFETVPEPTAEEKPATTTEAESKPYEQTPIERAICHVEQLARGIK